MENSKISENVTREELNRRTKESKQKADLIALTLPKGTKNILIKITGKRPATACHDIIMQYIEKMNN